MRRSVRLWNFGGAGGLETCWCLGKYEVDLLLPSVRLHPNRYRRNFPMGIGIHPDGFVVTKLLLIPNCFS